MTPRPNPEPIQRAIARIRHANGAVVGAGFLISESCLLTCAHVVAEALGLPQTTATFPLERIDLDLITEDTTFVPLQAQVVFWSPVHPGLRGEDIAGLQIVGELPPGCQPVKLKQTRDWWKHAFGTFGFPKGYDTGTWAHGELLGPRGGDGWVQMESIRVQGHPIQPGFSGSPIWDESLEGVVGMAVAADRKRETQTAYMIPTEILSFAMEALSLLEILSSAARSIEQPIKAAFKACCPRGWADPMPETLAAMVAGLQNMTGDTQHGQILQFAARLATMVPELSLPLENWVVSQGQDWQTLLGQIQSAPISPMSYLFIKVEDTKPKSEEYIVSALFAPEHTADERWNWRCRQLMVPQLPPGQTGFKLHEIPALLDDFLNQVDEFEQLTIECFLPVDLLSQAVDAWEIQGFGIPQPIGHEYRVVVRSVERLSPTYNRYKGDWRKKWGMLQQIQHRNSLEAFISADGCDPKVLLTQLKAETAIGLQLTQLPEQTQRKKVFAALLQSGLPTGLWVRRDLTQCNSRTELDRILECCVMELPDQITQARVAACDCDPDAHIGHHLSLLWENPDRLPKVFQYEMP